MMAMLDPVARDMKNAVDVLLAIIGMAGAGLAF
jgi:hypothetical protein